MSSNLLLAILLIGSSVLLATLASHALRKRAGLAFLQAQQETGGILFGALAAIYGILLAFVVVVVWEDFKQADLQVTSEAGLLEDLIQLSDALPADRRAQIRAGAASYARSVVEDEWTKMAEAEASAPTQAALDRLWSLFATHETTDFVEERFLSESISRLGDLSQARRSRLHSAHEKVPPLIWTTLILGGLLTLAFSSVFAAPDWRYQITAVSALAAVIGVVLVLIFALDRPFSGQTRIEPEAFISVLERLESP